MPAFRHRAKGLRLPLTAGDPLRPASQGFTLIELAVVMAILAIGLGLTISLVESAFYGNDLKSSLRRLQGIVNSVRYQAMLEGRRYELLLETQAMGLDGGSRYWTVAASGEDPGDASRKRPLFRSDSTRLVRVETEEGASDPEGRTSLTFTAEGLAEPAQLHIQAGGRSYVLVLEAFIPRLTVLEGEGAGARPGGGL